MAQSIVSKEKDYQEEEEEEKEDIDDAEKNGEEESDEEVIQDEEKEEEDASEEIDDGEDEEDEEEDEDKLTGDRKWKAEEDNEDEGEEDEEEEQEEEDQEGEDIKDQDEKESQKEGNDNDEEDEEEEDETENQKDHEGEDENEESEEEVEEDQKLIVKKNNKKSKSSNATAEGVIEQTDEKNIKEDESKQIGEVTQVSNTNLDIQEIKDNIQQQTVKEKVTKEDLSNNPTIFSNKPKEDISTTNSEKQTKEEISKVEETKESTNQDAQGKNIQILEKQDIKDDNDQKEQPEKDSNELTTQETQKQENKLKPVKIEARPGIIYDPKVDVDNYPGEYSDSGESDDESSGNGNDSEEDEDDSKIVKKGFTGTTAKKKKQKEEEEKLKKAAQASSRRKKQSLVLNVADTKYCVVKFVGKKIFKWRLQNEMEAIDWDICWTDNAVQPDQLGRMQPFQKINHFPGMFSLARKNHLARNLMKMRKNFPKNYQFFPQTWLLPAEFNDFRNHIEKCRPPANTFIAKPEASCQGRGIFLTKTLDDFNLSDHYVVQKYLHNPYLIDGLKFDFRLYVLLAGCDPLRIYLYYEGLTRFATEPYKDPARDNLENMCIHLTNYAINKDNPNFQFNDDKTQMNIGHKRSLTSVLQLLEEKGHDVNTLWKDIKRVLIKTIISAQPTLAHHYRSCQPDNYANNMCFELLGFDIIIDSKLKPWLLEVNHTPSFVTDTPLDGFIKKNAIRDSLKIMNVSCKTKNEIINARKEIMQKRVLTGKKVKYSPEEKIEEVKKAQKKRDEFEDKHLGGFERIFPIEDDEEDNFTEYLSYALKCYEESTGAHIRRNQKKVLEDPKKMPPTNPSKLNNPKDLEKIYNSKQPKKAIGPPRCAPGYYRPPTPLEDGTNKINNDTKIRGEDDVSDSNNTGQFQRSDSGRMHDFRIKKSNYNSPYNASNSKLKQKMKQQQQNRVAIGVKELRLGEEFIPFEQIQDGKIQTGNYKKISAYMMVTEPPVKVIEKNNKYQSKNDRMQQEKQQYLEQQQQKEQQQFQQNQQLQTQQWQIQQQQQTQMLAYQAQQQQAQMLTIQAQQIIDLPKQKSNYLKQQSQRLPLQPTDNAFTIEDERKQWLASAQRNLQYQLSQQQYQPQQQRLSLIKGPSVFPATNPTDILNNNKDILAAVGGAISGQYKANEKKQIIPYKQKIGLKDEAFKETGTKMFVQQKKFELSGISGNTGSTGGAGDISSGLLLTGKYNKSQDIFMQSKSSNGNYQKML